MGEEEEREIGLFRSLSLTKIPLSPWFCDSELWFFFSLPSNQFLNTIFLFLLFSSFFRLHRIPSRALRVCAPNISNVKFTNP